MELPSPIKRFFEATNERDVKGLLACFAPNAVLSDWGRTFHGKEGVAAWNQTDNIGVRSHLLPIRAEGGPTAYVVTVNVNGQGFNGVGTMSFQIDGEVITTLDIS